MNNTTLTGRLTADPQIRYTGTNKAVCNFTIAVNDSYNREDVDFIECVVWDKQAESLGKYQSKGSLIGVVGRLKTRTYEDKNQQNRKVTEVICNSIDFLGSKTDKPQDNTDSKTDPNSGLNINNSDLPF